MGDPPDVVAYELVQSPCRPVQYALCLGAGERTAGLLGDGLDMRAGRPDRRAGAVPHLALAGLADVADLRYPSLGVAEDVTQRDA